MLSIRTAAWTQQTGKAMQETIETTSSWNWIVALFVVLGLGVLVAGLLWRRKRRLQGRLESALGSVTYLVGIPKEEPKEGEQQKDFRELTSVMEQLFASFASLYGRNPFKGQPTLAFEIVALDGAIRFYVSCPGALKEFMEKQLHAHYPGAQVEEVPSPNIFKEGQGEIAAATCKLNRRYIWPVKTYKKLEAETLNPITNALSKLGERGTGAIQILIQPTHDRWRYAVEHAARNVKLGKAAWANPFQRVADAILEGMTGSVHRPQNQPSATDPAMTASYRMTPLQDEQLKLFQEKAAKVAFKTIIRVVVTAPDAPTARLQLGTITGAFAQFATPEGNNLKFFSSNKSALTTDYIFRGFLGAPIMILNTEELASLYHFPNRYIETPNIQWLFARKLPPPVGLPTQGTTIGISRFRAEEQFVKILPDDRRRHLFMIGKTGTGKTTVFLNMVMQDIVAGKGCAFVDPLGDAIEEILLRIPRERAEDVVLFDPSDVERPMGLNLLEFKTPEERDFLIAEIIEIFYKLFDPQRTGIVGPQWEHWARNACLTLMAYPKGGTLIEIPRLFTDDRFRADRLKYVTDPVVRAFWDQQLAKTADFHKSEMYNYFISKFGRFMTNTLMRNIIGQRQSSLHLRELMDQGKILLVNLSKGKIGDVNAALLGMILVSKLQVAAFSRADIPEDDRRDFYLYVDEFQNFTTDSFATILSEARKYHLNLNITNQYIAQLTEHIRDAVIGNAGTLLSFRVGAADAEFLVKEFPGATIADLTNLEQYNAYIKLLQNGTPTKPFSVQSLKTDIPPNKELGASVRQLSRLKFGHDRAIVEREIEGEYQNAPPSAPVEPPAPVRETGVPTGV